jgi:hypothetical protein
LLGLEILVAADLVRTVAVAPTLDNVLVLGLIVVIRTLLSFSLETEIEGVAPWRRALISGAETIRRASANAVERPTPPYTGRVGRLRTAPGIPRMIVPRAPASRRLAVMTDRSCAAGVSFSDTHGPAPAAAAPRRSSSIGARPVVHPPRMTDLRLAWRTRGRDGRLNGRFSFRPC